MRNLHVGLLLGGCLVTAAGSAHAQSPRARTLTFDTKSKDWVETPPPPAGTPKGDLHVIRNQTREGHYRGAWSGIKRFIKKHGLATSREPDLLIAKAEILIGRHLYGKAHTTLQEFLSRFAGSALTSEALRLEFVIAENYLRGAKRRVLGLSVLSGVDLGLRILDELSTDYPKSRLAELAMKTKADYLFQSGEHALAELEYARLLTDFPRSQYHQHGLRRVADAAIASYRGPEYDDAALIEAEERYREYQARYPADADRDPEHVGLILDTIREHRARKQYAIGAYYDRTDHLGSAIYYYQSVARDWPGTGAAREAARRLELLGATARIPAATAGRTVEEP